MDQPILNVAQLLPVWYAQVLSGEKTREYRDRRNVDPRLEAVTTGELLLLRECRSDRALLAYVLKRGRRRTKAGYRYTITLKMKEPVRVLGPKRQGWQRTERYRYDAFSALVELNW